MLENIKLAILVIGAMFDTMPQEMIDASGAKVKIPDAAYLTLMTNAVMGMVTGAGFQIVGISDAQLRGAATGLCTAILAYKAAPRVAV
jgi:hypothetical protein